ncbi:MAG: hypothetical protein H6560_10675 [Lewinellaceae bacterium]|nr:hypothetical protein [Lewinellaceae bacterium]
MKNVEGIDSSGVIIDSVNESRSIDKNNSQMKANAIPECGCYAVGYITDPGIKGVAFFKEVDGEVVHRVTIDVDQEEFLEISVVQSENGWFRVGKVKNPFSEIPNDQALSGLWVDGALLRVYLPDADVKVNLYDQPDKTSRVTHQVNALGNYQLSVIGCCRNWVYAEYRAASGESYRGWLSPEDICSTPISNC